MCWSHVFRNIRPKLAAIRKANAALGASMLADIESIQWMAQSEAEMSWCARSSSRTTLSRISARWRGSWSPTSSSTSLASGALVATLPDGMLVHTPSASPTIRYVVNFFKCFSIVPFFIQLVQGLEGTHKEVKQNHTFRTELPLGQLIQMLEQLVILLAN